MKSIYIVVLSIMTFFTLSCGGTNKSNQDPSVADIKEGQTPHAVSTDSQEIVMEMTGQIQYMQLEGGFFAFIAEDGSKYTPHQLAKEHRKNGLVVRIKATPINDIMTTTQFGQLIRIEDIKILDESSVKPIKGEKRSEI